MFVKYYLPWIARWSLIISRQIVACKNNDAAITMESSRIDVTRRIGRRIINDASQSAVYRRVGILSKRLRQNGCYEPRIVTREIKYSPNENTRCNHRTKSRNSSCQFLGWTLYPERETYTLDHHATSIILTKSIFIVICIVFVCKIDTSNLHLKLQLAERTVCICK